MTEWKKIFCKHFITYIVSYVLAMVVTIFFVMETPNIGRIIIGLLLGVVIVAIVSAIITYFEIKR